MTTLAWVVLVIVALAVYVTWTAGRLDRMHARVDAAWAALDAQLVRRAFAAHALLPHLPEGGEQARLEAASVASAEAADGGREVVENDLSRALRDAVPHVRDAEHALAELATAAVRVGLARSFHNSAVHDTRQLRRRRVPRLLRLAGHRPLPAFFDVDDTGLT